MTSLRVLFLASLAACVMPPASVPASPTTGAPASGYASTAAPSNGDASSGDPSGPMAGARPASAPAAPAAPAVVSVTLHNDCEHDVKLFLGEKPGFSSGMSTSLEANSTTSYQMKPGDQIWITDDHENGLSATSIGSGPSQRIRIMPGCSGFGPY